MEIKQSVKKRLRNDPDVTAIFRIITTNKLKEQMEKLEDVQKSMKNFSRKNRSRAF